MADEECVLLKLYCICKTHCFKVLWKKNSALIAFSLQHNNFVTCRHNNLTLFTTNGGITVFIFGALRQ